MIYVQVTFWIKPNQYKQWLVFNSIEKIKEQFETLFESNEVDVFLQQLNSSKLPVQPLEEANLELFDTAIVNTYQGYKEGIDFKFVSMSEEEIEAIGNFSGWQ